MAHAQTEPAAATHQARGGGLSRNLRDLLDHHREGPCASLRPSGRGRRDVLRRHAAATGVPVYAWGVMPDPVHLILGASPTCDIVTVVGQCKNLAPREAWRRGITGTFWQTSFWDHFLRGDERVEQVVERTPAGDKPPPYSVRDRQKLG